MAERKGCENLIENINVLNITKNYAYGLCMNSNYILKHINLKISKVTSYLKILRSLEALLKGIVLSLAPVIRKRSSNKNRQIENPGLNTQSI